MGLRGMRNHTRRIIFVTAATVTLYLYLNIGLLDIDLSALVIEFVNAIFLAVSFRFKDIPENVRAIGFDFFLCFGGFAFWTAFFAQFILPVHSLKERSKVPTLLFNSLGTERGPAIFIKEGERIERAEESRRKGQGVVFLDAASAAILQKKGEFTRAVGPGLVFTQKNEKISNTVDLRTQGRIIGPKDDDVIFFEEEDIDPLADNPDEQKAREARRMQTSGLTRDGIEVVPNIITIFRLDSKKGNSNTQYGYYDESVKRALLHEAIVPGKNNEELSQMIPWHWLPAHLAADLWREYLRKFTLNQFFNIKEQDESLENNRDEFDKTDFNRIEEIINKRLTQKTVTVMNEYGEIQEDQKQPSREYKILNDHGIKVIKVAIDNLRIQDEKKLIDRWKATWLQQAIIQKANIEKRQQIRWQKGENQALMEFSNSLISPITQEIKRAKGAVEPDPNPVNTLAELLRGTRVSIVRNPSLNKLLAEERVGIDEMVEWLKNYQDGLEENIRE
jgi:hypothetical protein